MPVLLSPAAMRWLWAQEVSGAEAGLLDTAGLAADARASWLRLRAFGGDPATLDRWPLTRDQQAFHRWSMGVEARLRARAAWDGGDVARLLVETTALPSPGPPILLAGFRQLSPIQAALVQALVQAGHAVERHEHRGGDGVCLRHRARDRESERIAMLAWMADRIAANPAGLHAAIVPDLDADRGALERALAAILQPALELPTDREPQRIFDLAGGRPLIAQPIVEAALDAVEAAVAGLDWQAASRLFLCEHIAGFDAERAARVRAEQLLRVPEAPLRIPGSRLAALAERTGAARFAQASRAAIAALEGPPVRPASAWAAAFGACLAAWGWAHGASPGSRVFQAAQRLGEVLREFAGLSTVAGSFDVSASLLELRRLLAEPFQAESGEPAIFVLDARDSLGVHVDSLWVAGLTATVWPRPASVDPLLPIEVQRALGMPGVSAEQCVGEANAIFAQWRAGADALVLSSPQFENDTEVDATPLLPDDCAALGAIKPPNTRERLAFGSGQFEPVPDHAPMPLAAPAVKGGARVLELQARCPFRAFAELRLGAAPVEEPAGGIDRRLRGVVLHRALQAFWTRFGNRSDLAKLEGHRLHDEQRAVVDAALADVATRDIPAAAIDLEREWQRLAVSRLIGLDLARTDFTVIEVESRLDAVIGGVALRLRIDRVDRVGDDLLVIDYKSGKSGAGAWRGARMDAPQLPLYAVLHGDGTAGIAFAEVGAAAARYSGVARIGDCLPGIKAADRFELTDERRKGFAWDEIKAQWRLWLEQLAADFAAGRAAVDPKAGAATCRHCHLASLCRVEAADPGDSGADGDDDA